MKLIRSVGLSLAIFLGAITPGCERLAFAQATTVIGGLGPGLGQSVNPFDPNTVKIAMIAQLQKQADAANAAAAAQYLQTSQDWLTNAVSARDAGRPIPTITDPPLKIHVDPNTGVETKGPDAVAQKPVLPAPSGNAGSGGLIANPNAPPDRLDQVMAGLSQMWSLLQAIQTKVASCK